MPEVRYLNHKISKNRRRYMMSPNFLKIQKTCFNRIMAFEAKMIYVSAEMECNYTLKQVFDSKISYFTKAKYHILPITQ